MCIYTQHLSNDSQRKLCELAKQATQLALAHPAHSRMRAKEMRCSWPSLPRRFQSNHPMSVKQVCFVFPCNTMSIKDAQASKTHMWFDIYLQHKQQEDEYWLIMQTHLPERTCRWWPSSQVVRLPARLRAFSFSLQGQMKSRPWSQSLPQQQVFQETDPGTPRRMPCRPRSVPNLLQAPWKLPQVHWARRRTSTRLMAKDNMATFQWSLVS